MEADSSSDGQGDAEITSFFDLHSRLSPKRRPAASASASASPNSGAQPLTVTQLTRQIDRTLRSGMPNTVLVRGEISSYRPYPGSGHHYFTLKDAGSCIDGVLWRDDAQRLRFKPQIGMEVLATGKVQVYVERGKYQLCATSLQPLGAGALELAFRQLKEKLEKEGLFAPERKKPIPKYPRRIVIVTSRQTAALQDILKVLRAFPWVKLSLCDVPVQGETAGRQLAGAIGHLNRCRDQIGGGSGADLILLARGGGSAEDLWCFNEEALARAIAGSTLPIVTGIGHEVDISIADLVADYHAHTPTEAAQVIMRQWRLAPDAVAQGQRRLDRDIRSMLQNARQRLASIERHEIFRRPLHRVQMFRQLLDDREKLLGIRTRDRLQSARDLLSRNQQRLDSLVRQRLRQSGDKVSRLASLLAERHPRHQLSLRRQHVTALAARLHRAMAAELPARRQRLESLARQLEAVGPMQVLQRGFSLTFFKKTGEIVRSVAQIKTGDRLVTRFADGEIEWTAEDRRQLRLFT